MVECLHEVYEDLILDAQVRVLGGEGSFGGIAQVTFGDEGNAKCSFGFTEHRMVPTRIDRGRDTTPMTESYTCDPEVFLAMTWLGTHG